MKVISFQNLSTLNSKLAPSINLGFSTIKNTKIFKKKTKYLCKNRMIMKKTKIIGKILIILLKIHFFLIFTKILIFISEPMK